MAPASERTKAALFKAAAENQCASLRALTEECSFEWEDVHNDCGQSLLHVAALEGSEDVVQMLLRHPKFVRRINKGDSRKRSPAHLAAAMGFSSVIERLVSSRAAVSATEDTGCTPLHLAVKFEWKETIDLLLRLGADPLLENIHGFNSVDLANQKENETFSRQLAAYQGQRKVEGVLDYVHKLLSLDRRKRPPARFLTAEDEGKGVIGSGDLALSVDTDPSAVVAADRASGPTTSSRHDPLDKTMEEACRQNSVGSEDEVIEWEGLKPVMVRKASKERKGGGSSWMGSIFDQLGAPLPPLCGGSRLRSNSAPVMPRDLSAPRAGSTATSHRKDRMAAAFLESQTAHGSVDSRRDAVDGVDSRRPSAQVCAEYAIFRMHMLFGKEVEQLGFEVEWNEGQQPSVRAVRAGGDAARRGLQPGDRIICMNTQTTFGRGREDLLPILKQRPVAIQIDREALIGNPEEPHIRLNLSFASTSMMDNLGLELTWRGHLPVASEVAPQQRAWAAGCMAGDAILSVDGKDMTRCSTSVLKAALQDSPQSVTVLRRPFGSSLREPWTRLPAPN